MVTISPISPGAGDPRPGDPVKPAVVAVHPDATSAKEDVVSLSPEAVQLIQATGLSGYENQELADGSTPSTIPEGESAGTALQLVG